MAIKLDGHSVQQIGEISSGKGISGTDIIFEQGTIEQTNNPFDLAIQGDGFFTVSDNYGTYYTRNGQFQLDGQGYIVNSNGARLMGANGAINTGGEMFTVSPQGEITTGGRVIDRLNIYNPSDKATMVKHLNGLFAQTGVSAQAPFTGKIMQGSIEKSNVSMIDEMMDIMSIQRSFQSCSKAAKMIDETLEQTVEIGRMG
jgi:flagellar basal-body rod protein FlgG